MIWPIMISWPDLYIVPVVCFLLCGVLYPIRKQLLAVITFMSFLYLWAYLVILGAIVAHKIHTWLRLLITLLPHHPAYHLLVLWKLDSREKHSIQFPMSYDLWLKWVPSSVVNGVLSSSCEQTRTMSMACTVLWFQNILDLCSWGKESSIWHWKFYLATYGSSRVNITPGRLN